MIDLYLLYLDESGNTGLEDTVQPFYVLGGVLIEPGQWHSVVSALAAIRQNNFRNVPSNYEFHGTELELVRPIWLRDRAVKQLLRIPRDLGIYVPLVIIDKQKYIEKYAERDAAGNIIRELKTNFKGVQVPRVKIKGGDNHVLLAFRIMAETLENKCDKDDKYVIVFRDRDRDHENSVKQTFEQIRQKGTKLLTRPLTRLIENIYFIDSKGNRCMQLADVCVYYTTKALMSHGDPRLLGFYRSLAPSIHPVLYTVPKEVASFHESIMSGLATPASRP